MDAWLAEVIEAAGVGVDGPPDPTGWARLLDGLDRAWALRRGELGALEKELASLRADTAHHHSHLGTVLGEVTRTLGVFQEAIQGDADAQERALDLARRRFSLQLNASWSDDGVGIPEDTAALQAMDGTSLRELQQGLRDLGKALSQLVAMAREVGATQQQLELAGSVQMMLVPGPELSLPNVKVWSWFEPATECGGDWWTGSALGPDASLVVVGDVTGHGAPAAIIAGTTKGACDLARMGMRTGLQAHQLMRMLNRVIIESAHGHYMMTGLAIKIVGRSVWVANAGHPSPYLVRGGEVTPLATLGEPPLGAEAVFAYSEHHGTLEAGDMIVAYTDGVTEAEDANGRQLGERALRAVVASAAAEGPERLVEAVRKAVGAHQGRAPQADDISFVVIHVL